MSRRVSEWATATIRPRVSGKVTMRTSRASLVTEDIRTVPQADLDFDPSTAAGPARRLRTCRPLLTAHDLGGHHQGAGVTIRVLRSAPAESGSPLDSSVDNQMTW